MLRQELHKRKLRHMRLLEVELDRIRQELIEMGAHKILLFGSAAQGARELGLNSDLDLVVVLDSQEDFLTRIRTVYQKVKPRTAIDILVYTPCEYVKIKETSPFMTAAIEKGRILY